MMFLEILKSSGLLLVLLNPFLLVVNVIEAMKLLDFASFRKALLQAGAISFLVYCMFAILGDRIFSGVIKAEFASFQIFGGLVLLIIALGFVFKGHTPVQSLSSPDVKHIAGSIAMPVMIGPGTISYSVIIGQHLSAHHAVMAIFIACLVTITMILLMKKLYDYVHHTNEPLVQRYIEIAGRITALILGTISVEMIMRGVRFWVHNIMGVLQHI